MSQNPIIEKYFTKGDRARAIADTLVDSNGDVVDLTGNTVKFRMTLESDDSVKINSSAATIDSATGGKVSYTFTAGDIDTAGNYWGWWIRMTGTGLTEHFPGDGKRLRIIISEAY